ncbi:uncharacterized protein J4E78_002832 [Alternaria triticimaculans]|uniref:uncharacterized protein n=1 Tax=Alternaria triticimaculans TaxID=297637 RepID=UPI0020C37785|nr:uncharacterized protein J4E78_002832 [Alternaria triticimaculans]KAI4665372.1 hypothetical protein J4E78_002832 [Alternaria triticimaculans]
MASKLLRINRNVFLAARPTARITSQRAPLKNNINDLSNHRAFTTTRIMSVQVDSNFISQITAAEKKITGKDEPHKGGPTAKAQQHVGQNLTAQVIHDITEGEKVLTGSDEVMKGGPTSIAQSALTAGSAPSNNNNNNTGANTSNASGKLDSSTLSKITDAEKKLTGEDGPVPGGPTAQAQSHAKEPITSEALHDITEGEKKVTGGERVKGGPTSTAQSELAKSRS